MYFGIGWIDTIVLLTSIALAILIGLRMSGKTSSVESFLLGDRNLPWWAILGSIVATETSTATVLSVPGVGYGPTGMKFLQIAVGLVCGRLIIVFWLLPLFFDGKLSSAYVILERRFGNATKYAASAMFLITRNIADGLRLFLAAIVLEKLVGWPFVGCAITIGTITIFYTYFGGMRSVVWNDCLQLVIYMVGGIASLFVMTAAIPGGWETVFQFAFDNDKLTIFQWVPPAGSTAAEDLAVSSWVAWLISEPYSFFAGLIGGAVLTMGTHGTDQMMVQRYLSARSRRDAAVAIALSGLVVMGQFALFLFLGILLACFYSIVEPTVFERADEVYLHFIINSFPQNTGMVGLMLAAFLAAAMSTLSSSLNASASAVLNDFYLSKPKFDRAASALTDRSLLVLSRRLAIGFGVLQVLISLWAHSLDESVINNALTIAGFSAGLLLGLFAIATLDKRATQKTALVGAACGLVALLLVQFVVPMYGYAIAWPWFALIGLCITWIGNKTVQIFSPSKK